VITASHCTRPTPDTCVDRLWPRLGKPTRPRYPPKWRARASAKPPALLWQTATVALRSARKCRYVQPPNVLIASSVVVQRRASGDGRDAGGSWMERDDWVRRVALHSPPSAPPCRRNTTPTADDASRCRDDRMVDTMDKLADNGILARRPNRMRIRRRSRRRRPRACSSWTA
jgi:hypothetical protein